MLEANEMEVLWKIVGKRKIDRIRSKQITESCGIQPIKEWVERIRQWDEHLTRMVTERLVKITFRKMISGKSEKKMERLSPR